MSTITFREAGWKYELMRPYIHARRIRGFEFWTGQLRRASDDEVVAGVRDGRIFAEPGYAWDGPSGPTADTPSSMRGSLIHDIGYQLARSTGLAFGPHGQKLQRALDREMYQVLKEDGMPWWRRRYWYRALRWFARPHFEGRRDGRVLTAP